MAEAPAAGTTHSQHFKNILPKLGIGLGIIGAALGLFVAVFGWSRFMADFWPLDRSFVGPNLCASIFLGVLYLVHNEWVVLEHGRGLHEDHKRLLRDLATEILKPTDDAEGDVVAEEDALFKQEVRSRLDETTPGGIGTLAKKLEELALGARGGATP